MFSKALLVATAIGAVAAQLPGLPNHEALAKRQSDDSDNGLSDECQDALSAVATLYSELPTPPAVLFSVTITDPCATPTFTGQTLSAYKSYTSAAVSFYSAHSAEYNSVVSACATDVAGATDAALPVCTSGANSDDSGNDSSNGSSGSGSGNGGKHNAAARPTGTILAGVAAAAIMGAVAML